MRPLTGSPPAPPASDSATVIACHGRQLRLRRPDGTTALARPARGNLQIVCGDEVRCARDAQHDELRVIEVRPRRTALQRSDARGRAELVAANVDLLLVVLAPLPRCDPFIADRYLAAAGSVAMDAAVVCNKCELPVDAALQAALAGLRLAGYPVHACSAREHTGLGALLGCIGARTAMLVGQSGVGKSSLTRALLPQSDALVGELASNAEGRHTTSTARLYDLPGGGHLLDAPGVRDFSPAVQQLDAATLGFAEVAAHAGQCRFTDCRHLAEPGCAVRAASERGALDPRRYESYRRLRRLRAALLERQRPR
ncbi:MAG: ribosome small subunit-dependent GTPase A [Gammaproteobacteria bacterium]|nr:ribosome small subunit-dependent GTPase A [Gammaproteobacteria bacterium]